METKVHNITKQLDDSYYQKKMRSQWRKPKFIALCQNLHGTTQVLNLISLFGFLDFKKSISFIS